MSARNGVLEITCTCGSHVTVQPWATRPTLCPNALPGNHPLVGGSR